MLLDIAVGLNILRRVNLGKEIVQVEEVLKWNGWEYYQTLTSFNEVQV